MTSDRTAPAADDVPETAESAAPVQTRALDRGLQLLSSLAENPAGLSAPDLAERNGLSRATVYRLLSTMVARGFVSTDARLRRYWLGPALERCLFGPESRLTLAALATPEMSRLCDEVKESVGLHVRNGFERIVIRKVEPDEQPLRYVIPVGTPRELATGASGAVLMAELSEEEIRSALAHLAASDAPKPPGLTLSTVRNRAADIRLHGFCEAIEETVSGLASVAAPVYSSDGRVVAALAVSGPLARFGDAARQRAAKHLVEGAQRISAALRPI